MSELNGRTKKVATMLTPNMHRAFGVPLKLDGGRTMDDFLRAAVENYVTNHRFADSVAGIVRNDSQEPEESPR